PLTMGSQTPEVRALDIERIEILRGPQGTLYGASAEGGLVRFITNKPKLNEFEANIGGTIGDIDGGDEDYDVDAMVNIPLIDNKLAVRIVGFHARDGGYIDNVLGTVPYNGDSLNPQPGTRTNADVLEKNLNKVDWLGGRVQALWDVNENWNVIASGTYQKSEANGNNDFYQEVGDLETIKFKKESRDDEWYQIGLTIEGDLGFAKILSATNYFDREIEYIQDTTTYASYFDIAFGASYATYDFGPDPVGNRKQPQDDQRWNQEIRLSWEGSRWHGVLGFFYQHNEEHWDFQAFTDNYRNSPAYAAWSGYYPDLAPFFGDAWWHSFENIEREDWAFFGEATFNFTDNLDVIAGGRFYDVEIVRDYHVERPFGRPDRDLFPSGGSDGFLPKIAAEYNVTDDKMLYILFSRGFRNGGQNRNRGEPTLPINYGPDTLNNYEAGAKTEWWDSRLQVNLIAFHQMWNDYQLEVVDPAFGPPLFEPFQIMVANVGDAVSNGLEWDIQALPLDGLQIIFNGTWLFQAELDEDVVISDPRVTTGPSFFLPKGTGLPFVAELHTSAVVQYSWPMQWFNSEAYVRFQYSYTGESSNKVDKTGIPEPFFIQGDYDIGDIKVGIANESWEAELYFNNIWDERPEIFRQWDELDALFGLNRIVTGEPRNFGLRIRKYF
ncbi:MAG: TonB-dependent receptor, partial [Gammaproteobacteria bacterium]